MFRLLKIPVKVPNGTKIITNRYDLLTNVFGKLVVRAKNEEMRDKIGKCVIILGEMHAKIGGNA